LPLPTPPAWSARMAAPGWWWPPSRPAGCPSAAAGARPSPPGSAA